MADKSYFIETEFSEYESEVFAEEQIKDTFISVLRTVDDADEGLIMVMGASEPVGEYTCISSVVYGDHCRVELYRDFNNRVPDVAKDLAIDDAMAAFIEFFNDKVPSFDEMKGTSPCPYATRDRSRRASWPSPPYASARRMTAVTTTIAAAMMKKNVVVTIAVTTGR